MSFGEVAHPNSPSIHEWSVQPQSRNSAHRISHTCRFVSLADDFEDRGARKKTRGRGKVKACIVAFIWLMVLYIRDGYEEMTMP